MVRKRIFGIILLPILLLSSCNKQKPLRSDIANFIASFSLQESMNTYREAGYESIKISILDGTYRKEIDKVDYNIKDEDNLSYVHNLSIYDQDDQLISQKVNMIEKQGDKYVHTLDGVSEDYTVQQCSDLIKTFFYIDEPMDGYHDYGMYYGDYVASSARTLQDYVKIDEDNELYVFEIHQKDTSKGKDVYEKYTVNKLGMLSSLYSNFVNKSNSIEQTITVYNTL